MGVTIADVARRAGVGKGTVSRVLNDRPNVDPETRARVLAAIAELDYVPSPTAQRLSLRRTLTIGVVVPYMTRPAAVERLRGIEWALVRAGYDMIVLNVETEERRAALFSGLARRERVDGLLVVSLSPPDPEIRRIVGSGIPTVLVDAHHRQLPRVVVDDVAGGQLVAEHLLSLGHRRLGWVGDPVRHPLGFSSSRLRLAGFRRGLAEDGVSLPNILVAAGDHTRRRAAELGRRLLTSPLPPTAIACASDTQALGVIEAARGLGLEVPGNLSVTGYDDIEVADHVGLTTVHQPLFETGVRAAQRLISIIDGEPVGPLREVQPSHLVVRRTTSPPID